MATTTTTTRMLEPIRRKRLRLKKPPPPARVDTEGSSVGGGKFAGACGGTGVPQSSQKRTLEGKVLLHCEHSTVSRLPQLRQKLAEEAFSYPQLVQAISLGRLIKSPGILIGFRSNDQPVGLGQRQVDKGLTDSIWGFQSCETLVRKGLCPRLLPLQPNLHQPITRSVPEKELCWSML